MEMVFFFIAMVIFILEVGKMMYLMEKVYIYFHQVKDIKDKLNKDKKKEMVNIYSLMEIIMKVIGIKIEK